jgi:predicted Zn-dependent peptidase
MASSTYTFPNGFRVIHERPHNRLGICAMQVFVDFGSAHESVRGSAHFIEHMCFKGTRRYPSYRDLFTQQHQLGNIFNAHTNTRYTVYTSKVNDADLPLAINLVSSMMLESTFPNKDLETEQRVVLEECLRSDDNGENLIQQDADSRIYAGSSFEYPVDTPSYHKHKFSAKKIKELYHNIYVPQNMLLSIVTDIPFQRVLAMLHRSKYGRQHAASAAAADLRRELYDSRRPSAPSGNQHFRVKAGSETAHVKLSFRTCPRDHPDRFVLDLLQHIVGGTLGSKLFILLREKHGLTYVSRCETDYTPFSGTLSFYAQVDKHKLLRNGNKGPGVVPLLVGFIDNLIQHGITVEELRVGKRNKQAQLHLALEQLDVLAEYNGIEWLFSGDQDTAVVPFHQFYEAHIKRITCAQILRVCRTYLRRPMVACFVGPHWSKSEQQEIVEACKS